MTLLKRLVLIIALVLLVIVGILLQIDNADLITLKLLGRESAALSVFWWQLIAFTSGLLVGFALCFWGFVRGKHRQRKLERSLMARERELADAQAASEAGAP